MTGNEDMVQRNPSRLREQRLERNKYRIEGLIRLSVTIFNFLFPNMYGIHR